MIQDNLIFSKIYDTMRKEIIYHPKLNKDLRKFSKSALARLIEIIKALEMYGKLEEPEGKKLDSKLYEIRISDNRSYRIIYAYFLKDQIILLSGFIKKSQKTPRKELKKAKNRLKNIYY